MEHSWQVPNLKTGQTQTLCHSQRYNMHHVSPLICLELIQLCLFLYHYTSTPMLFLEFLFYSLRSALDLRMKLLTLRKKFTILINSRMQEQYQLSTALGQYLASIGQSELRSCIQTCKVGFVNHESSHKNNLPLLQILKLPHFLWTEIYSLAYSGLLQICDSYSLEEREYFFDRSPRNFDAILGLYRNGKLHLAAGVRSRVINVISVICSLIGYNNETKTTIRKTKMYKWQGNLSHYT